MRTYLQQFFPCLENRHVYPYRVIYPMMLEHIDFAPITILGSSISARAGQAYRIAGTIGNPICHCHPFPLPACHTQCKDLRPRCSAIYGEGMV